ncbi:MAG: MBOAT family protein [Pedosphaera sp.]|nr:MBOAT family protein [Pedosphaera sp.]
MLFNSELFFKFFAAFLLLYYLARHHLQARNVLIVLASYLFYGWWDYRFLSLLIISSVMDFCVGLGLERNQNPARRKLLLGLSLTGNLALLGFFKYYDFFAQSLTVALEHLGLPFNLRTLDVILPVGISFYTFQTMSYAIDVYRREIKATANLVDFLAYVSFFPQLVAGPIERAQHLLPQFARTRIITMPMLAEGIWLCLWGMFKKVVIADNLAPLVEMVYGNADAAGPMIALATVAFAFQIYGDFSGYSDIARGTAKILGFDIMVNFNVPFAAKNVREFWRRWHISLSTWLRDYLYISLGGNRSGPGRTYLNLFLTMLLGGLWHGAAWNFVLWGAWHGIGLVTHRLWTQGREASGGLPKPGAVTSLLSWTATTLFVLYGWLLFRAGSWEQVAFLTERLAHFSFPIWAKSYCINLLVFTLPLIAIQFWQERSANLMAPLTLPRWGQVVLQGALLIGIALFWGKEKVPFIYFQF